MIPLNSTNTVGYIYDKQSVHFGLYNFLNVRHTFKTSISRYYLRRQKIISYCLTPHLFWIDEPKTKRQLTIHHYKIIPTLTVTERDWRFTKGCNNIVNISSAQQAHGPPKISTSLFYYHHTLPSSTPLPHPAALLLYSSAFKKESIFIWHTAWPVCFRISPPIFCSRATFWQTYVPRLYGPVSSFCFSFPGFFPRKRAACVANGQRREGCAQGNAHGGRAVK